VPRSRLHRVGVDLVEQVNDLDVGELVEPPQRLRRELLGVQRDRRGDAVPVIVERLSARRAHPANGSHAHEATLPGRVHALAKNCPLTDPLAVTVAGRSDDEPARAIIYYYSGVVARQRWVDRSAAERRRSYLSFAGLYLLAFVIALVLGWRTPAVVLAVIGVLLTLLGLWNPDPNRRRRG